MNKYIIQKKIFFGLIFMIIFFIFILSVLEFSVIINTLQNKEIENMIFSSNLAQKNIENSLKQISEFDEIFYTNNEIFETIEQENPPNSEVESFLNTVKNTHNFIENIYIEKKEKTIFSTNLNIETKEIENIISMKSKSFFSYKNQLFYRIQLYNLDTGNVVGSLIIEINKRGLNEIFINSSIGGDETVLILDEKNNIIFQYPYNIDLSNRIIEFLNNPPQKIIDSKLFLKNEMKYSSWINIRIIPLDVIYKKFKAIFIQMILFVFILSLMVLFLVYKFILSFTKPILYLCDKFKELENGNFDVVINFNRKDEIGELGDSFNNMAFRIKKLLEEKLEIQEKKSKLEFQALQAQMNPHFLYNILDSVKWMAILHNVPIISNMINNIIRLLKYNISFVDPIVSLDDEIKNVKNYVEIQKYRYGNCFKVEYSIDENCLNSKILKLTLQPIVENAFHHAFNLEDELNLITLKATIESDNLIIEIQDNGKGIDLEKDKNRSKGSTGIGLENIDERIKLYFGEKYGIFFEKNKGTIVRIILPYVTIVNP